MNTNSTIAAGSIPRMRLIGLVALCLSAVLLIPVEWYIPGTIVWLVALVLVLRDPEPAVRRRLGTILAAVAVLALSPIHTATSTGHFLSLAFPFFIVILGPALYLRRTDPGVVRFRFWPRRLRAVDIGYVFIAIPLCWIVFELYFGVLNPEVPRNWFLPPEQSTEATFRLFVGINSVGIWDELFFVNTVFAVLRSVFPMRIANPAQAVIYTAVLNDMAFTGWGPVFVYVFALTQGAMFETSENLLYVLIVHLIVDAFLFAGIVSSYYPTMAPFLF